MLRTGFAVMGVTNGHSGRSSGARSIGEAYGHFERGRRQNDDINKQARTPCLEAYCARGRFPLFDVGIICVVKFRFTRLRDGAEIIKSRVSMITSCSASYVAEAASILLYYTLYLF